MNETNRLKKASVEQKEFLLAYMEENPDFANDRSESKGGKHFKATKWRILATHLNRIVGVHKDVNQWRKYWRDQKLHAKEREALVNASFQTAKPLTEYEERLIMLLANPSIKTDVSDADILPQCKVEVDEKCSAETDTEIPQMDEVMASGAVANSGLLPDWKVEMDDQHSAEIPENSNTCPEMDNAATSVADGPLKPIMLRLPSAVPMPPTSRKRKWMQSELSPFERKMSRLKEEEIRYLKESNELKKESLKWRMEYERKLLDLREKEVYLRQKELDLRELTIREKEMALREREMSLREKEFEMKIKNEQMNE